jgi:hypothetical protein
MTIAAPVADIVDAHRDRARILDADWRLFTGVTRFAGPARPVALAGPDRALRALLETPGAGAVAVVTVAAGDRAAVFGDGMAKAAEANGWAGVVIDGALCDVALIRPRVLGVAARRPSPASCARAPRAVRPRACWPAASPCAGATGSWPTRTGSSPSTPTSPRNLPPNAPDERPPRPLRPQRPARRSALAPRRNIRAAAGTRRWASSAGSGSAATPCSARRRPSCITETEAFAEGRTGPERFGPRFHRIAGFLLGELHGHHQIEDMHYFPRLAAMEPSLQRGFDLLDADHHALHDALDAGAAAANATLAALKGPEARAEAARTRDAFAGLARLLDRHLADEEDIVAPLLAHRGEDAFR